MLALPPGEREIGDLLLEGNVRAEYESVKLLPKAVFSERILRFSGTITQPEFQLL